MIPLKRAGLLAFAALLLAAGCSKRQADATWPGWKPSPLVVVNETRDELPDGKANITLVVKGDATRRAVEDFLRAYVDQHRRAVKEMWVALYLDGMDVKAIEYAFASYRPGEPVRIMVRESAQTYR